jgi:hypothetical protein
MAVRSTTMLLVGSRSRRGERRDKNRALLGEDPLRARRNQLGLRGRACELVRLLTAGSTKVAGDEAPLNTGAGTDARGRARGSG